jgi:hypothetical protein
VLAAEYPPEQRHGLDIAAIFQPHIRFFIARLHDVAVGCGGVALFPDYAEVKRMYVREGARGQGRGRRHRSAHRGGRFVTLGFPVLRLETSPPAGRHAVLCPRRISGMSGVRRLCVDGAAGHCDQRVSLRSGLAPGAWGRCRSDGWLKRIRPTQLFQLHYLSPPLDVNGDGYPTALFFDIK